MEGCNSMPDSKTIGRIMRHIREEKSLSQEVVSGFAVIARSHLCDIECGRKRPTMETYFRICRALNVHPGDGMRMAEAEWEKQAQNSCKSEAK